MHQVATQHHLYSLDDVAVGPWVTELLNAARGVEKLLQPESIRELEEALARFSSTMITMESVIVAAKAGAEEQFRA